MESARPQPAAMSGRSTVFVGFRIFAVSAMNRTPAKQITGCSASIALRERYRESPTKSATSWTSGSW